MATGFMIRLLGVLKYFTFQRTVILGFSKSIILGEIQWVHMSSVRKASRHSLTWEVASILFWSWPQCDLWCFTGAQEPQLQDCHIKWGQLTISFTIFTSLLFLYKQQTCEWPHFTFKCKTHHMSARIEKESHV